jgi:SPP1 gp7 family putative phage head morphogenesis protein
MANDPSPSFGIKPLEAIDFFRQKLNLKTTSWTDIWQSQHARAFVVAGANTDALVADFRNAIDKALAEGKSLSWFRGEFDKIVEAHGWSYKGKRGWRTAVIYNTNMRMAHATGQWARITRLAPHLPYLRYVAVHDNRTRPLHKAWDNTILRWDDPWWKTHFPPNGWNCRCAVQQLSESDIKRLGLKISPQAPASPEVARAITTPQGVKYVLVPKGIDPGFAYNPGEAAYGQGPESLAMARHGKWAPLEKPFGVDQAPASALLIREVETPLAGMIKAGDETTIRDLVRKTLGGDELIVVDPTGAHILMGQAIADRWLLNPDGSEAYIPLLPKLIEDPSEVRIGFVKNEATGEVALRRRYLKLVKLKNGRMIGMAADVDGRILTGFTFFKAASQLSLDALRAGFLLWFFGQN